MGKKKARPTTTEELIDELDLCAFADMAKKSHSDVQGSYTGDPLYGEQPVQDADDL